MIFPKLNLETTLQVDDKTRLDASLSTASGETIQNVEIRPEDSEAFVSVYNANAEKWYLDWAYETDGVKNVTIRITTNLGTKLKFYSIDVLTEEEDALFSYDSDLFPYEPNLLKYLPKGKNSFIYAHRAAQKKILAFLDEQRIWKIDNTRYTKEDIVDKEEFNRWSIFQTLLIIFESSQVSNADIFQEKRLQYEADMKEARNRASLRLDADGDGNTDELPYNVRTTRLYRR
jgi:hypothetical protein